MESHQLPTMPGLRSSYLSLHGDAPTTSYYKHRDIGIAIGAHQDDIRNHYFTHGTLHGIHIDGVPPKARKELEAILNAEAEAIRTGKSLDLSVLVQNTTSRRPTVSRSYLTSSPPTL